MAVSPTTVSTTTASPASPGWRLLQFISRLTKSLWLFFPGILFVLLTIASFWTLGQGKDIIVSFMENESRSLGFFDYTRIVFFLAIAFWVYASWYSSRIIAYIQESRQKEQSPQQGADIAGIPKTFLDEFPRTVGNGCFLALELAVLQSPVLSSPIGSTTAWIIFLAALILLHYLNQWISNTRAAKPSFRKTFFALLTISIILICVSALFAKIPFLVLLGLLLLLHIAFIFYINLRRVEIETRILVNRTQHQSPATGGRFEKIMCYFCIPLEESGYFKWLLYIGGIGVVFYVLAIFRLDFARQIGPFPFMILAFGVLLAFGNIVTAFSVRLKVNFHFILFLLAFLLGFKETHFVRTIDLKGNGNTYADRPALAAYLSAWLNDRNVLGDSSRNGYDIYFVMANGGASRSGYWTAAVLGKIEDSSLMHDPSRRFSDHVFCLSGTSGGGVGVATFFSLLRDKQQRTHPIYSNSARAFLKQDYFTYTAARMLGPDFFNYIFHISAVKDRAAALEMSFEESSREKDDSVYSVPFYDTLSKFPALKDGRVYLPVLCVNTTRMQDGNPGVVTNLALDQQTFNHRVDVLSLLSKDSDLSITSGAILGARFPYLSPAGRIGTSYFVDGGYFDNSGAGVVQEMIRGIINLANDDSCRNGAAGRLYQQVRRLHFKVLHITNSPGTGFSDNFKKVPPIKNDLLAPVLTITGAYDMQTTVNDSRLMNYISDLNNYTCKGRADYTQISLYEDGNEWWDDPLRKRFPEGEPPYAMNWFMSDTTMRRIDNRLIQQPRLNALIKSMYQQ